MPKGAAIVSHQSLCNQDVLTDNAVLVSGTAASMDDRGGQFLLSGLLGNIDEIQTCMRKWKSVQLAWTFQNSTSFGLQRGQLHDVLQRMVEAGAYESNRGIADDLQEAGHAGAAGEEAAVQNNEADDRDELLEHCWRLKWTRTKIMMVLNWVWRCQLSLILPMMRLQRMQLKQWLSQWATASSCKPTLVDFKNRNPIMFRRRRGFHWE